MAITKVSIDECFIPVRFTMDIKNILGRLSMNTLGKHSGHFTFFFQFIYQFVAVFCPKKQLQIDITFISETVHSWHKATC